MGKAPVSVKDQFTEEQKKQIIDYFNEGKSQKDIAGIFNVPRRTMMKLFNHLGLKRNTVLSSNKRNKSLEDRVIKLREDGETIENIAIICNIGKSSVFRIIKKYNVVKKEKDISFVVGEYVSGLSISDISKKHNISTYKIRKELVNNNIKIREPILTYKKHKVSKNVELDDFVDSYDWFYDAYIVRLYSINDIAMFLGRSVGYVSNKLSKYKIKKRSISESISKLDHKNIIDLYKSGKSLSEISNILCCTVTALSNILKENNISIRTSSEILSGDGNFFYGKKHSDDVRSKCAEIGDYYGKKFWKDNPKYVNIVREKQKEIWSDLNKRYEQSLKISKLRSSGKCNSKKCKINIRFGEFICDSRYEFELLNYLDGINNIVLIEKEFDCIEYEYNDQIKTYIPDFRVWFDNGECLIIETKNTYLMSKDKEKIKIYNGFGMFKDKFIVAIDKNNKFNLDIVKDRIENILKPIDFNFKDIILKDVDVNDYTYFYSCFHYLGRSNRYGITFGAYLDDNLIACCSFGSIVRNGIAKKQNLDVKDILELVRFCIHPDYHKRNFASWFMSKSIKLLKNNFKDIKMLISFADKGCNHDGAIYKASNWILDGETQSSYHYESKNDFIHKKTLYERAKRVNLSEKEYAHKYGWNKIFEYPKLRFIYRFGN